MRLRYAREISHQELIRRPSIPAESSDIPSSGYPGQSETGSELLAFWAVGVAEQERDAALV